MTAIIKAANAPIYLYIVTYFPIKVNKFSRHSTKDQVSQSFDHLTNGWNYYILDIIKQHKIYIQRTEEYKW